MPDIRPFRAWRYDTARAGDLASVIAPPYDVISPEMQRSLYARSPFNVVRVELTAPDPSDPPGSDGDSARHQRARTTFEAWKADGILRKDSEPALYLYRQTYTYGGRRYDRHSVIAAVRMSPWNAGAVLPHERTMARPRAERLALLLALSANISPIWALFEDPDRHVVSAIRTIDDIEGDPPVEQVAIDDEGIEHGITAITARQPVDSIRRALAEHPLFIADGHHRYETALAYRDQALAQSGPRDVGPRDFVLMVLTDATDPGLIVLPTHRLVRGIGPETLDGLHERLHELFEIALVDAPTDPEAFQAAVERALSVPKGRESVHRFVLLGGAPTQMMILEVKNSVLDELPKTEVLRNLDVWLAHTLLLDRMLGIGTDSKDYEHNVSYTRDAREVAASVRSGESQLGLLLAPTPVSQMMAVARSGSVMPQKSTYFYPKPATGLAIRVFEAP